VSQGRSFEAIVQTAAPLPRERALQLLRGAADALDSFHARTGVHGSMCLNALVAADDGQVRLLPPGDQAEPSARVDAQRYLSPQRLVGEPARLPDDLFALGVVAVELLAGRPAPDRHGASADNAPALQRHIAEADLPSAVKRVLLTQVSTAPASRFASGAALVSELDRAFATQLARPSDDRIDLARPGAAHLQVSETTWNRRFGPHGRLRVAPDANLVLSELPDSTGPLARPARRRVSRRTDYPDLALPGVLVLAIIAVLCSVYLFPVYYMLVRHL
jgi:serine/threonine-protein kinase